VGGKAHYIFVCEKDKFLCRKQLTASRQWPVEVNRVRKRDRQQRKEVWGKFDPGEGKEIAANVGGET